MTGNVLDRFFKLEETLNRLRFLEPTGFGRHVLAQKMLALG